MCCSPEANIKESVIKTSCDVRKVRISGVKFCGDIAWTDLGQYQMKNLIIHGFSSYFLLPAVTEITDVTEGLLQPS